MNNRNKFPKYWEDIGKRAPSSKLMKKPSVETWLHSTTAVLHFSLKTDVNVCTLLYHRSERTFEILSLRCYSSQGRTSARLIARPILNSIKCGCRKEFQNCCTIIELHIYFSHFTLWLEQFCAMVSQFLSGGTRYPLTLCRYKPVRNDIRRVLLGHPVISRCWRAKYPKTWILGISHIVMYGNYLILRLLNYAASTSDVVW
jgi:hypothetical protein